MFQIPHRYTQSGSTAQTIPGRSAFFRALMAGTVLSAVAAQPAASQSEGEAAETSSLEEITIFATKSPIPAFDYPGQVSVVTRDVVLDFNPSSISDIFAAVPGVQFFGGPRRSGEVPTVRGIGEEGVLVLFDGARQSFVSGHDGRLFIDPELLRSAEVIRGPASALYGSGALGGVIALNTINASDILAPGDSLAVRLNSGYQSVNDEVRIGGLFAWESDDGKADVVGSITYRDSGDIALGNGLDLPADDQSLATLLKGSYRPNTDLELSLRYQRLGGSAIDPNNPQGANVGEPGNPLVDRNIDSNTVQARAVYAPADNNWIDLDASVYYSRNIVEESELDSDRIVDRDVETIGLVLNNRSRFDLGSADLAFTYGFEIYQDDQSGSDNTSADGTRGGVPNAQSTFYGAFLQAELTVEEPLGLPGKLTFLPGFRWDRFESSADGQEDSDDSAVSPKIAVSYKPIPEVLIFANWAEAFRAPSFNELYANGIHFQIPNLGAFPPFPPQFVTNFFIENPDLQPEDSQTWEVGGGLDFDDLFRPDDSFTFKASYFQSNVDNLIDLAVNIPAGCFGAPFPPCGSGAPFGNTSQNVNVTRARLSGFEAELNYESDLSYIRANFATIDGTDRDTGDFVGALSPNIFFADTGLKFFDGDLRLGSRLTIAGDFDEVNEASQARDSYTIADVYAVFQPSDERFKGIRIDLGVDNITDADYEVVNAGVSQPGRNFKIGVAYQFGF